jgi:hypothetical protein
LPTDGSVDIITSLHFMPDNSLLCGCRNGSVLLFGLRIGVRSATKLTSRADVKAAAVKVTDSAPVIKLQY